MFFLIFNLFMETAHNRGRRLFFIYWVLADEQFLGIKSFSCESVLTMSNKQKSLMGNIHNSTTCFVETNLFPKKKKNSRWKYKMGSFKSVGHAHMHPVSKYKCACRPSPPPPPPPPSPPPLRVHFKERQRCQGNKQCQQRACWEEFSSEL